MKSKEGKLSLGKKMAIALGMAPSLIMFNTVTNMVFPIYNIALGVSPVLLGIAMAIPRFWDAISDPLMGNISDNTRSRWGRRRPYIAIGAVLGCIVYACIWNPPAVGEFGLFIYFTIIALLLSTAYTIYFVPMYGLTFELSSDYNERTRLMAWRSWGGTFFGLLVAWGYKLCFIGTTKGEAMQSGIRRVLGDNITGRIVEIFGDTEVSGARIVGFIFAGVILVTGLAPALILPEKVEATKHQKKINLLTSFKYTLSNTTFLIICGVIFLFIIGQYMVAPLQSYMCIYYIFEGDKSAGASLMGLAVTTWVATNMICIPIISWCGVKFGKRKTLMAAMTLGAIGNIMRWFLMTPEYPYLFLFNQVLLAPGLATIWIMEAAMIADVTDLDELKTGLRREGMFGAVQTFAFKLANAVVLILSGLMIKFTGINVDLIGPQSPETILKMRALFSFVPAIFLIAGVVLVSRYPLSRKKCAEIRAELEKRHSENETDTEKSE